MFQRHSSVDDLISQARQKAGQKVERKTNGLQTTISSTKKKYEETQKMIQSYDQKIDRLTKQKNDLIRKNQNRLKYLEDLSR